VTFRHTPTNDIRKAVTTSVGDSSDSREAIDLAVLGISLGGEGTSTVTSLYVRATDITNRETIVTQAIRMTQKGTRNHPKPLIALVALLLYILMLHFGVRLGEA